MKGKGFFRGRGGSNFEFGLLEGQLKGVNRGEEALIKRFIDLVILTLRNLFVL